MICELTWPLIAVEQADDENERTAILENKIFLKCFLFEECVIFTYSQFFKKQS